MIRVLLLACGMGARSRPWKAPTMIAMLAALRRVPRTTSAQASGQPSRGQDAAEAAGEQAADALGDEQQACGDDVGAVDLLVVQG